MNYSEQIVNTHSGRMAYKEALARMIAELPPSISLTANFNQGAVSLAWAEDKLEFFWKRMNRELLGPRWPGAKGKIEMIAVPEHLNSNLHLHSAVVVPEPGMKVRFAEIADEVFRRGVPKGSAKADLLQTAGDRTRWADYMTKTAYDKAVIEGYRIFR